MQTAFLWKKTLAATFLILLLCVAAFIQRLHSVTIPNQAAIAADMKSVPCGNEDRLEAVRQLFIKSGAVETDIVVEKFEKVGNLVVTKNGRTAETVIVGAHYDKTSAGCGAIDNWTGIVIIANIYAAVRDVSTEKTYKFVAFGDEEKGLLGARAMAGSIQDADIGNCCAMANFDSFGFSYPQAMGNSSNEGMIRSAEDVAKSLDIPFGTADIAGADADSGPFNDRKIPAITFHGLSDNWREFLHTQSDQTENVKIQSVYLGYRFGLRFLEKIDSAECGTFRQ